MMMPSHQLWRAKMEARLECVRVARARVCTLWLRLAMLGRCLLAKICGSELSRKLVKGALLVGQEVCDPGGVTISKQPPLCT